MWQTGTTNRWGTFGPASKRLKQPRSGDVAQFINLCRTRSEMAHAPRGSLARSASEGRCSDPRLRFGLVPIRPACSTISACASHAPLELVRWRVVDSSCVRYQLGIEFALDTQPCQASSPVLPPDGDRIWGHANVLGLSANFVVQASRLHPQSTTACAAGTAAPQVSKPGGEPFFPTVGVSGHGVVLPFG
jgi:hypothetical protein